MNCPQCSHPTLEAEGAPLCSCAIDGVYMYATHCTHCGHVGETTVTEPTNWAEDLERVMQLGEN